MPALPTDDPRRHEILRALERAWTASTNDIAATAGAARAAVAVALRPANASAHVVSAVGHAHIDTAWLWPLRETKRKTARTFSNVTALAEEYPEFIFACSQAQQYAWIKEEYPEIYQRIQRAVAKGQWIPAGGMWVEADGNLPGGESLARQLVPASGSSWTNSASTARASGCPTRSATRRPSRSSRGWPGCGGS